MTLNGLDHRLVDRHDVEVGRVQSNGIEIEYATDGDRANPAMLLVGGLGSQLIDWPNGFCELLAGRGFFVIRFDNRDTGLSTKMDTKMEQESSPAATAGFPFGAPAYTVEDMADDSAGLLEALGIQAAHVVGASAGGTVAQFFALRHPDKTSSLCLIMSTTGDPAVGGPTPQTLAALMALAAAGEREELIESGLAVRRLTGSPGFPTDEAEIREQIGRAYDRCFCPQGLTRQITANMAAGDRTERLANIGAPTVVVHGTADTLVSPAGGEALAKAVPGAELVMIDGMGHELPRGAWPEITEAIVRNARSATP